VTGATGPAGPTGLTWQGTWSDATAYALKDAVEFNGTSYISIQAGTANQPDTNPLFWNTLAQAGATGATGAVGAIGAAGATGATRAQRIERLQGVTGATGPAGPPGVTWQGTWSNATAYALKDAV